MSEEMPERLSDAESTLLSRIENSIKNDGFSGEMIQNYLQNENVSIPGLRWKMICMLRVVEEPYAACYFEILADIETRCNAGKIPKKEIADLSQSYSQAIRNLSEAGYPALRIRERIQQTREETGHCPTPYDLYSVLIVLQEGKSRELEADSRQLKESYEDIQKLLSRLQGMEEEFREQLQEYGKYLAELKEAEKDMAAEKCHYQNQSLDQDVGKDQRKLVRFWLLVKKFFHVNDRKDKQEPVTLQKLIGQLKRYGCPPAVMQEVQKAMEQGVSMDEIHACIAEAYQGEDAEQMAVDALRLFTIRQLQLKKEKGGS